MTTRNHKQLPEELKEWLIVDLTIPEGLRWKKSRGHKNEGDPAGCKTERKNGEYYVVKFKQILYLSHRVIYFLTHNIDPADKLIDHINKDKNNTEIRLATNQENVRYRKKGQNCKSKYKGVTYHKRDKLWCARITINKVTKTIGYFKSEVKAAEAYDQAARKHFKEFAFTNFIDSSEKPGSIDHAGKPR